MSTSKLTDITAKQAEDLSLSELYILGVPELVGRENSLDSEPETSAGIAAQFIHDRRIIYKLVLHDMVQTGFSTRATEYGVANPITCSNQREMFETITQHLLPGKHVFQNNIVADLRQRKIQGKQFSKLRELLLDSYKEATRYRAYFSWLNGNTNIAPSRRFRTEAEYLCSLLEHDSVEMWFGNRERKISERDIVGAQWRLKWGVDCRVKAVEYIVRSISDPKLASQIAKMLPTKRNSTYENFYSEEFIEAMKEPISNCRIYDVMGIKLIALNYESLLEQRERFLNNLFSSDKSVQIAAEIIGSRAEENKFLKPGKYNAYHTTLETGFADTVEVQNINLEFFLEYFGKTDQRHDVMEQRSQWHKSTQGVRGASFERTRNHQIIENYLRWLLHTRYDHLAKGI